MGRTIRQPKSDSKGKAIASLTLGIISISLILLVQILRIVAPIMGLGPFVKFVFFRISPLSGIIGLILGISTLKSTKRNFAIAGIILCLIGLIIPLYYLFK